MSRDMCGKYILDGHEPVPCPDVLTWGTWLETAERRVGLDVINGVRISTVFLGLDHQFGSGPPLLFETMVFGDSDIPDTCWRCSTWEEAEAQHAAAVEYVKTMQLKEIADGQVQGQHQITPDAGSELPPL